MTLDAWMYGNPETVAIRRQENEYRKIKACSGCIHHKKIDFNGEDFHACGIKRGVFGLKNCKHKETK